MPAEAVGVEEPEPPMLELVLAVAVEEAWLPEVEALDPFREPVFTVPFVAAVPLPPVARGAEPA